MTSDQLIEKMLDEASKLRVLEEVLATSENLLQKNPKMNREDAIKLALDNAKLHSGLNYRVRG